ncbi:hypothetical protein ACPYZG_09155 [Lacticaseibacillus rhamnosus]|jgi:hypothetical protein
MSKLKKANHLPLSIITIIAGSLSIIAGAMNLASGILLLVKSRHSAS